MIYTYGMPCDNGVQMGYVSELLSEISDTKLHSKLSKFVFSTDRLGAFIFADAEAGSAPGRVPDRTGPVVHAIPPRPSDPVSTPKPIVIPDDESPTSSAVGDDEDVSSDQDDESSDDADDESEGHTGHGRPSDPELVIASDLRKKLAIARAKLETSSAAAKAKLLENQKKCKNLSAQVVRLEKRVHELHGANLLTKTLEAKVAERDAEVTDLRAALRMFDPVLREFIPADQVAILAGQKPKGTSGRRAAKKKASDNAEDAEVIGTFASIYTSQLGAELMKKVRVVICIDCCGLYWEPVTYPHIISFIL